MEYLNSNFLNLLAFLFGGVGVIFIQLIYEARRDHKKKVEAKINALDALIIEKQNAIELCNEIIKLLGGHLLSVHIFTEFRKAWFEKYTNEFLDFSDPYDTKIYSYLNGAIILMKHIEQLNANSHILNASSRALTTFGALLTQINQGTLDRAKELLTVLSALEITDKKIIVPQSPTNIDESTWRDNIKLMKWERMLLSIIVVTASALVVYLYGISTNSIVIAVAIDGLLLAWLLGWLKKDTNTIIAVATICGVVAAILIGVKQNEINGHLLTINQSQLDLNQNQEKISALGARRELRAAVNEILDQFFCFDGQGGALLGAVCLKRKTLDETYAVVKSINNTLTSQYDNRLFLVDKTSQADWYKAIDIFRQYSGGIGGATLIGMWEASSSIVIQDLQNAFSCIFVVGNRLAGNPDLSNPISFNDYGHPSQCK